MKQSLLKGSVSFLLALSLLASFPIFAQAEQDMDAAFYMVAHLERYSSDAGVYPTVNASGPASARIHSGDQCRILGEEGKFYHVDFNGVTGYVVKSKMELSGESAFGQIPEENLSNLGFEDAEPRAKDGEYLVLKGVIRSQKPLDTLYAYVWDQRLNQVEKAFIYTLETPSDTVNASVLSRFLPLDGIKGGRKTFVLEGGSDGEITVLFRSLVYMRARCEEALHVTKICTVSQSNVLNTELDTVWGPTERTPALTVDIPLTAHAALMTLEWRTPPAKLTVEKYDSNGKLLSTETTSTGFYTDAVALDSTVHQVRILPVGEKCALSTLRVYPKGYHQQAVQEWQTVPEKVDLMVFSAHQDDEFLFFGGTIPYYSALGKDLAVVYMTNCGRERYREALDGLWSSGLKTHPIFLGWKDKLVDTIDTVMGIWNRNNPYETVVRLIRRYKPDVIVTHDFEGEYGHAQHKATAKIIADVLEMVKDPAFDPESAKKYGVWDVKKVYIHLYGENQISMDWEQPLNGSSQETAMFLAREGYDKHRTQQASFSMIQNYALFSGKSYDNRVFGLYYSTVGPDVEKNDFFENIPPRGEE